MTAPAARLSAPDDRADLVRLGREAAAEIRGARGGPAYLRELGRRDDDLLVDPSAGIQLVGTVRGAVVGTAALTEVRHADGSTTGAVSVLYVESAARRVGVGERLLSGVLEVARSRGWSSVDATALPGDRDTKNFFEAAGLVTRRMVVSIDL